MNMTVGHAGGREHLVISFIFNTNIIFKSRLAHESMILLCVLFFLFF